MLRFRQLFLFACLAIVFAGSFAGCKDSKNKSEIKAGKPGLAKPAVDFLPVGENPVELGGIAWGKNFAKAKLDADKKGKPIYLMLDEVPGCKGCKDFGTQVLSHPIVIAAVSEYFVPVFINNRPDKYASDYDKKMVKYFKESYWDYPVVRYLDEKEKDIIPRKQTLKLKENINRIISVLKARKVKLPIYLQIADIENSNNRHETAYFNMGCFWSGEARLGKINGVLYQTFGFIKGSGGADEVVKVVYDPKIISLEKLLKQAKHNMCATRFIARNETQLKVARKIWGKNAILNKNDMREEEPQYYLKHGLPGIYFLPITPLQAVKINSYYRERKVWEMMLTPGQLDLAKRVEKLCKGKKAKQIHKMFSDLKPDNYRRLNKETLCDYKIKFMQVLDKLESQSAGKSEKKSSSDPACKSAENSLKCPTEKCSQPDCSSKSAPEAKN